ncbi:GntR family transcriptional regulator [Parageobacillus sp. KH3-4]|uniref:GntR family transcriptional regulator n=1 Tax=Parageobacillus sp. KH3-4 TaxID=2916802 RepID=UPI001FCBCF51|nr:GntR family transcriptional regulator [Parageobacillus sp. KH3-4]BDG47117.1 GntR family transcriptional regulator [Parageobacillus sp. KH3-4]
MFELDVRSRQPIYEQLVEKMKEMIIREIWKPNEQLPSVRMLAKQLTINPNTIQKAYRELEHQGFIYSIPGKGNFVSPQPKTASQEKIKAIRRDIIRLAAEALFLGVAKEEVLQWIEQAEQGERGGKTDDLFDERYKNV